MVSCGSWRLQEEDDHGPEWRQQEDGRFILTFQRLFFAMCRPDSFPMAELEERLRNKRNPALLQQILRQTVFHPLSKKYPPSVKYRRIFLSELIKKHEREGAEPLDELYDALGEVLRSEDSLMCYKNYFLKIIVQLSGKNITLAENVAVISEGTTGLVTWEAALYFAEWAMENPEVFNCRTILELGSGIGLAGIAICKTCNPERYIFSDCHPNVLKQLRKNIIRNNLLIDSDTWNSKECEIETKSNSGSEEIQSSKVTIFRLDWGEITQELISEIQSDIIMATDIIYDPEVVICLVSVLKKLLVATTDGTRKTSSVVYLGSTIRNPETYHQFKMELDKVGIEHYKMKGPSTEVFPYNKCTKIELLKLCYGT
ncbi:protein-lysine N-methyltransferase EEF2KMT isoform X1 [Amblyraja radiata]|uniref:protein-lysine N-methyltransferase EEF2KMT isoform X1 n=1 Tax=Amblyraja radiata TaxID=386614 RepID=UPI001402C13E|nr:protein-lysine N-methyltransferase EEF2KMT isoform X1 [Amblyraja radiata]